MYALDTNIIIRYLRNEKNVERNLDNTLARKCRLYVPKAVDYEIRRGFNITPTPRKETAYKILIEKCPIVEADINIWERAILIYGELYRKGFTVGEIDILIGAFCIENDYTLVTNNTSDFINMSGLKIVDWTQS